MEKEVDEESKSTKQKLMLTKPDWLDLPVPVATNIILEHLEIVDYIRFSAVCKEWYSIQKEHRIRYSPSPPPLLLPFPWIGCRLCDFKTDEDGSILFYQPDKQISFNIPFRGLSKTFDGIEYGHDCILFLFDRDVFNPPVVQIFSPIAGVQMKLPPCSLSKSTFHKAHISSPLTDPNCTLVIVNCDVEAYMYRLNDNCGWRKIGSFKINMKNSALCNNKFYLMDFHEKFYMIDTLLPDPVVQMIEMDESEIHAAISGFQNFVELVDFFGELVMIVIEHVDCTFFNDIEEFYVYRADFLTKKWVRMETLGDGVLFYSSGNTFALRALDVGCKKNTIYLTNRFIGHRAAWRAFDLSTGDWTDGPPVYLSNCKYQWDDTSDSPAEKQGFLPAHNWCWFLPTLHYFSSTNTNGACQNICLDH